MRKTQIIATIGPATESEEQIKALLHAGADVIRFNTKHNVPAWHYEVISRVKHISESIGIPVQILLDLQGPEVRITLAGESFEVKFGQKVIFTCDEHSIDHNSVLIPAAVVESVNVGNQILLAGGACEFEVVEKKPNNLITRALIDCQVTTRKTMNTPDVVLDMPSILTRDIEYIEAVKSIGVEWIGLSFVRNREDITKLRHELVSRSMSSKIVAKIENRAALTNLDEIITVADALMVARGDLGVEIPFWEVPYWQKEIIRRSNNTYKPVITATQMLLSMAQFPRPTRAEVSDVANSVLDGTNFVMLSEETSIGAFPIKTVETMSMIVSYYEQFLSYVPQPAQV